MTSLCTKLLVVLVGTLIFVGIPLLAWGVADVRGFLGHPARVAYLVITVLSQILVFAFVPQAGMSRGDGAKVVKRQRFAVVFLQLCTLGIIAAAPYSDSRAWSVLRGEGFRYGGVVLYTIGLFVMNWAIILLGRHFSVQVTVQEDHQLVTDGPYRYVRHPRYLGILICFTGVALIFASVIALGLAALLLVVLHWRIHDEEALMAESLPKEWASYAAKTARLLPGIY